MSYSEQEVFDMIYGSNGETQKKKSQPIPMAVAAVLISVASYFLTAWVAKNTPDGMGVYPVLGLPVVAWQEVFIVVAWALMFVREVFSPTERPKLRLMLVVLAIAATMVVPVGACTFCLQDACGQMSLLELAESNKESASLYISGIVFVVTLLVLAARKNAVLAVVPGTLLTIIGILSGALPLLLGLAAYPFAFILFIKSIGD